MKKYVSLILIMLTVLALLVACTDGDPAVETGDTGTEVVSNAPDDTVAATDLTEPVESAEATAPVETVATTEPATFPTTAPVTSPVTDPITAPATVPDTDPETAPATVPATDPETVPVTEPETDGETDPVGVRLDNRRLIGLLVGTPHCVQGSRVELEDEGYVFKISSTEAGDDPYIALSFSTYYKAVMREALHVDEYRYIMFRVKAENCSQSIFEILYAAGENQTITGEYAAQGMFDNSSDGWQYIVLDMQGKAGWSGELNTIRFDYQPAVMSAGETMYISAIWFAKDEAEMQAITRLGLEDPFVVETDPVIESRVEAMLEIKDPAAPPDNKKLDAEHEDASLNLWFNHAYTKTHAEDITSTGWYTYLLRMAKNESEGVHMLLASTVGHNGLTVSVTDFTNENGDTLKTELMYGYYFNDVDYGDLQKVTVPDPTPWVKDGQTFNLLGGRSYMYIIKATTAIDSPAGDYTATVTVTDSEGNEIKRAEVHAHVWNFALPEATSCKTQMDLSWYNIYVAHKCWEGDDSVLYKNYYDLLLNNRVCAYTLPYAKQGTFTDDRIVEYLDNPRVTAFNPIDWKNHNYTDDTVKSAYAFLSQKPEWLEKSYFYIVDEPGNKDALDRINAAGVQLKEHFPGYKMMAPMHLNYALNSECTEDYISYIADAINVWCFKPYFYTTFAEYSYDRNLTYRMSAGIEKNLGTFGERMEAEQAAGDELWWYVTRRPENPEITLLMDTESVRHRILFWQQKLYNVDSFLYYLVNDWYEIGENRGLNSKHETATGVDNFDCYGNGVLVYCGEDFGVYGGVGSLRLENVRDGIEDFEYLTILSDLYGKEITDALIHRLTTDISHYNMDIDNFTDLRIALGNIIEQTLAEQAGE